MLTLSYGGLIMARRGGVDIEGLDELRRMIRELGKVPTKVASKAARAGAKIAFADAKSNAPVDTGALQGGLIMRAEKTRKRGKKVFDIFPDARKSDIFVKKIKDGTRYYYPASQEYGFFARNGRYIPGFRYLQRAIEDNENEIEKTIVKVGTDAIDKIMRDG